MRLILCPMCGEKPHHKQQHPEDAAMGIKFRRVEISHVKKPPVHHVTINGEAQPEMKTLMCDGCGVPIQDGEKAVAITQWLGGGMGPWENEYQQE